MYAFEVKEMAEEDADCASAADSVKTEVSTDGMENI